VAEGPSASTEVFLQCRSRDTRTDGDDRRFLVEILDRVEPVGRDGDHCSEDGGVDSAGHRCSTTYGNARDAGGRTCTHDCESLVVAGGRHHGIRRSVLSVRSPTHHVRVRHSPRCAHPGVVVCGDLDPGEHLGELFDAEARSRNQRLAGGRCAHGGTESGLSECARSWVQPRMFGMLGILGMRGCCRSPPTRLDIPIHEPQPATRILPLVDNASALGRR
jgi:hypothetical protein